jgi:hypothetical protein
MINKICLPVWRQKAILETEGVFCQEQIDMIAHQ